MREVLKGLIWTATAQEVEDLCKPESFSAYAQHGIRAVLTVTDGDRPKVVASLPQLCIPINERDETPALYFDLACRFVKAFGPTVVHCHGGLNRSRVFAAALMHRLYSVPLEQAVQIADPLVPGSGQPLKSMREWAAQR
jgi:hypothetical protein